MTDLETLFLLAHAKGTDKQFREWVQRQPSCLSGQFDWSDGVSRCEAAHIRRAGESGTAYKAEYACVPMRHEEHALQHQKGETAVLNRFRTGVWSRESAREFFDAARLRYLSEWIAS